MPSSRHGGTAQIGRALATALRNGGIDVDVSQPENTFDLSCYDGFVLGSAVYAGRWTKEARAFIDSNADTVRTKPTWLFSSGPVGHDTTESALPPKVLERLMALTDARQHQQFGGRIDLEQLGRLERFIARWARIRNVDRRDWDQITEWGTAIAHDLVSDYSTGEPLGGRDK